MKFTCVILSSLFAFGAVAQDSIKLLPPVIERPIAPFPELPENAPYTIRLGDLRVLAQASFETEWNDNIVLTDTGTQQDFILRPKLELQGVWPLTGENSLNLTLGAGYEAYTEHPQYSRLLITPGSAIAFKLKAGEFMFDFHDRVSYENDSSLYGNISGLARIGGLFNTTGFSVSRDFRPVTVTLGYDHQLFLPSSSQFNDLNDNADTGTARVAYTIQPGAAAGIEAGGGATSYQEDILSSFEAYNVGAFTDWQITPRLRGIGRAGYVAHHYDTPLLTQGRGNIPGYYMSVAAVGTLSPKLSYHLEGGREETVSIDGALLQQWYVTLGGTCEIMPGGLLLTEIRYENAHVPFANAADLGYYAPTYDRVLFRLRYSYPIARRLLADLTYNLIVKDSQTEVARYTVNSVILGLTFTL